MKQKIKRLVYSREKYLEKRSIRSIAASLGRLSTLWLDNHYPFRKRAVKRLVRSSGYPERMVAQLLNALFRELTKPKLLKLLKAELVDPNVLDKFQSDGLTEKKQRAYGPRVITHIFSGNVPNPAIISFILGMLAKSVNLGKASSKDEGVLDIYLASLKVHDPHLAAVNQLIGSQDKKSLISAIENSDLVVAYGSNESLKEIRSHVPVETPFMGYGHRVSFSIYAKEALHQRNLKGFADKTAHDIWLTDQRGCLSPMEIFVEEGGAVTADQFCAALSEALARLFDAKVWRLPSGRNMTALGFGGRKIVRVRTVKNFKVILEILEPLRKYLQAVSLEVGVGRRLKIAEQLSRLGINRICRAGRMQCPPVTWHHDGKRNLAPWLNWTDLEL